MNSKISLDLYEFPSLFYAITAQKKRCICKTEEVATISRRKLIHTYNRYPIVVEKEMVYDYMIPMATAILILVQELLYFALGYNNKEYNNALKKSN